MPTHLWEHDCVLLVAALFSLRKLTLISNTQKFRLDSAALPHLEKKIISKTYSAVLRSLNNTQGTQTMANRVSSMDHQTKLYFNANLRVYMKL